MSTEPLPDTWSVRDLPVLREVVRVCDDTGKPVMTHHLEQATGLSKDDVRRACVALASDALIDLSDKRADLIVQVGSPSPRARRLAGQWPTAETGLERMLAALDAIAKNTDDADTRTRAQKFRAELAGAGKSIGLAMATSLATGTLPGQ